MGLDKETIEKRVSRIELDIDHMNQMIDENLKLNENGNAEGKMTLPKSLPKSFNVPHDYQEVVKTRSEASTEEYYDWPESQQEQDEQSYTVAVQNQVEMEDGGDASHVLTDTKPPETSIEENEWEDEASDTDETNEMDETDDTDEMGESDKPKVEKNNNYNARSTALLRKEEAPLVAHGREFNGLPATQQQIVNAAQKHDLYVTYDDGVPHHKEFMLPPETSSLEQRPMTAPDDPLDDSYETFDSVVPNTAETSRESNTSVSNSFADDIKISAKISDHSTSGFSIDSETNDSIHIPKNVNSHESATANNMPPSSRHPTNPFRVVSVGVMGRDGRISRKTSGSVSSNYKDSSNTDSVEILQKKLDPLIKKCTKIQREINYLTKMNSSSSLPIEDSRKLSQAIAKLQEYLDKKNKEKYDMGVLLSRQLRRGIDRGENGQFWIGSK